MFLPLYDWALLPVKRTIDPTPIAHDARVTNSNFRYLRMSRVSQLCKPWRAAAVLGWDISSPVDVTLAPIGDVEISPNIPASELQELASATGLSQMWARHGSRIGVSDGKWMRLYDFKMESGWQSMFLPNGQGSIEWILGWTMELPVGMSLLIGPAGRNEAGALAEWGLLDAAMLQSMREAGTGFSVAIRPSSLTRIVRGQTIARAWIVGPEFLSVN